MNSDGLEACVCAYVRVCACVCVCVCVCVAYLGRQVRALALTGPASGCDRRRHTRRGGHACQCAWRMVARCSVSACRRQHRPSISTLVPARPHPVPARP